MWFCRGLSLGVSQTKAQLSGERNFSSTWRWRVISTVNRNTAWWACRKRVPYQQHSFSQKSVPILRDPQRNQRLNVWVWARVTTLSPPACQGWQGQGWGPPSKSTAGLITLESFTGTDHCLLTGSYFGKLCADTYGSYFAGDFSSLFNSGICW